MALVVQLLGILNHRLKNCRCNFLVELNGIQKHISGTFIHINRINIVFFKISLTITRTLSENICASSVPNVATSPNDVRVYSGSKSTQSYHSTYSNLNMCIFSKFIISKIFFESL